MREIALKIHNCPHIRPRRIPLLLGLEIRN